VKAKLLWLTRQLEVVISKQLAQELFIKAGVLGNRHVFGRSSPVLSLRSYRCLGGDRMFEVCVEPFLRMELRAVAGQIEQLDFVRIGQRPSLHWQAVC
jgi:hypothetical protein